MHDLLKLSSLFYKLSKFIDLGQEVSAREIVDRFFNITSFSNSEENDILYEEDLEVQTVESNVKNVNVKFIYSSGPHSSICSESREEIEIFVNENSDKSEVISTLSHELTHVAQFKRKPKEVSISTKLKKLRKELFQRMVDGKSPGDLPEAIKKNEEKLARLTMYSDAIRLQDSINLAIVNPTPRSITRNFLDVSELSLPQEYKQRIDKLSSPIRSELQSKRVDRKRLILTYRKSLNAISGILEEIISEGMSNVPEEKEASLAQLGLWIRSNPDKVAEKIYNENLSTFAQYILEQFRIHKSMENKALKIVYEELSGQTGETIMQHLSMLHGQKLPGKNPIELNEWLNAE